MKRSRIPDLAVWCSGTLLAVGCAQIAGLSGDYHEGTGGVGNAAGTLGHEAGASGTEAGGDAGASVGGTSGGGASGGRAGSGVAGESAGSAGVGVGGSTAGGSSGSSGTGGSSGTSGSSGSGGSAGSAAAGAGGGATVAPVRIGFSEFHDSASGGDGASSHLANATFAKPAGTTSGDFIFVFFGADHKLTHLTFTELQNAGWTLLDQKEEYGGDGQATYLIYKFAGTSEPDPIVFANINPAGAGDGVQGLLSVYRGVSSALPINAYKSLVDNVGVENTSHFTTPTPSITTSAEHCRLIAGLSPDTLVDSPVITSWPVGFVEDQVSVVNPASENGWANIYSAEAALPGMGMVAGSAFSWDSTTGNKYYGSFSFVVALTPAQ